MSLNNDLDDYLDNYDDAHVDEKPQTALAVKKKDVAIQVSDRANVMPDIVKVRDNVIQIRRREIQIDGKKHQADMYQLITMIKQVTQMIGDYKKENGLLGEYMISALRKARASMVSDLQTNFHVNWQINKQTGDSEFWM